MMRLYYRVQHAARLMRVCLLHWRVLLKRSPHLIIHTRFVLRQNQLLLIDNAKRAVIRCSLNNVGNSEIRNNVEFLIQHPHPAFPAVNFMPAMRNRLISGESLLSGATPTPQEVSEDLIRGTIAVLNDALYNRYKIESKFNAKAELDSYEELLVSHPSHVRAMMSEIRNELDARLESMTAMVRKTRIHGDLTYRNIVVSDRMIGICDWSRSGIGFPEFDVYLLVIDARTYSSHTVTFPLFFQSILDFFNAQADVEEVGILYKLNPDFEVNQSVDKGLRALFLYRMLVLATHYLRGNSREIDHLVNQVRSGICRS